MHLKTLSIKGFKSFADTANLELEPGVTVVVGPNGSGKSNVVDAIAWVLGAQAPKSVRSQKMDDVIFAGTSSRQALGRAEVTLTIDNTDGVLPIEFPEVAIRRILFRSGDSEYSINGAPCRLLDVQDLLSDSGVGRQQHIIISQGQIDAVLNARPEDRRAIIEEAAGVLKFRKRKERAERRLGTTDEHLARVQDLVREVRRGLRPLERQAEAARKHGDLFAEVTTLRRHLAGRELAGLTARLEADRRQRHELGRLEAEITTRLAGLDADVLDAEAELAALGGSDLNEILSRARSLDERLGGRINLVAERRRRLESALQATVDTDVVASLESDLAKARTQLEETESAAALLAPEYAELELAVVTVEAEQGDFVADMPDDDGSAAVRAAELRKERSGLSSTIERDRARLTRIGESLTAIHERRRKNDAARNDSHAVVVDLEQRLVDLTASRDEAAAARAEANEAFEAAADARRLADAEASRWSARADALAQALDSLRSRAGADALAGSSGVLGTLLDLVAIDEGLDAAVEAALGEALQAVVVAEPAAGRAALGRLASGKVSGAVLPLGRTTASTEVHPSSIRHHVRPTRHDVAPLLDALLGPIRFVDGGWDAGVDQALAEPAEVFVTRQGDRFAPSGWRLGDGGSGATGAALDEARGRADDAAIASEAAVLALDAATASRATARTRSDQVAAELTRCERELATARSSVETADARDPQLDADEAALAQERASLEQRVTVEDSELAAIVAELPAAEAAEAALRDRERHRRERQNEIDGRRRAVASLKADLDVRAAGLEQRRNDLQTRITQMDARLSRLEGQRKDAAVRRTELERRLAALAEIDAAFVEHRSRVRAWLGTLSAEAAAETEAARAVSTALASKRRDRAEQEKALSENRERVSRLELDEAEARVRLETLTEVVRRDLDIDPAAAMQVALPELPAGASPEARVRDLERDLKLLGPINPLALEEYEQLKERYEFLDAQLTDAKNSRRELTTLIKSIDAEIVQVFTAAYADVAENFVQLFSILFPGGRGRLSLTDVEDLLDCGIEIEAKPSGKNVKKLSLLSGGERSLTALAFLFSVFRSRPSPFYVMDEVEAALDDVNLHRFLQLIDEFRRDAQLVIVSHQKRTMEAADVLYGVSMKPGGSSKVVSEKVEAKALV